MQKFIALTAKKQTVYGEVTADHIARGKRLSCRSCPVAFSVASYGKHDLFVVVDWGHIRLSIGKHVISFRQPDNIRNLISSFDGGCSVKPITWSITGYGLDKYFNGAYIKESKK